MLQLLNTIKITVQNQNIKFKVQTNYTVQTSVLQQYKHQCYSAQYTIKKYQTIDVDHVDNYDYDVGDDLVDNDDVDDHVDNNDDDDHVDNDKDDYDDDVLEESMFLFFT